MNDSKKSDSTTTLQDLKELAAKFRDERDWNKHHTPKNLAISISIEAAELMEHFQWDRYSEHDKKELEEELADILIYCFHFAETMEIDMASAFRSKLDAAAKKYPVEIFKEGKDDAKDYKRIKQEYRQGKKK